MSTIIDCGNGRFIAGDPVDHLEPGQHWCSLCQGKGIVLGVDLGVDWDDELSPTVCSYCGGLGVTACPGPGCARCTHEVRKARWARVERLQALGDLYAAAWRSAFDRHDYDDCDRHNARRDAVSAALHELLDEFKQ